jgi:ethanolamine utilization protein EutN
MLIARVLGEVVATQKHASHEGRKILMVQPLNLDGSERGDAVLALDSVDAGVGDRVLLVTEGYSAMTSVGRPESPIDMAVIGVIDRIDLFDDGAAAGSQGGVGLGGGLAFGGGTADAAAPPANLPVRDRRRRRPD